jgi:tetratricopeptide (TPR) repeat protein
MSIDAYTLCPGGTGKKIKFCCPELLDDLKQLQRMGQGEQFAAALKHIERLERTHPHRACLLAIKGQILQTLERWDEAGRSAATFLEHYPDNPIALAQSAGLQTSDGPAAMAMLQRAIAATEKHLYDDVYDAMGTVALLLANEGHVRAAWALWQIQVLADKDNQESREMLARLANSRDISLLVKDNRLPMECPPEAPWKSRFDEAMEPVRLIRWSEAVRRFATLAEQMPEAPLVWGNLAVLRSWLAETSGCIEALRKYATLDVPLEDAVEAEALALTMSEEPLGDRRDILKLTYTIKDADHLVAVFSTMPQATQVPTERWPAGEDETPPKAVFLLMDRPMPETAEDMTIEAIPRALGRVGIFGRRTDRDAQLEVEAVASDSLEPIQSLLSDSVGDELYPDPTQEVLAQVSATQQLLQPRWQFPRDVTHEQVDALTAQRMQHAFLEEWPRLPLGLLEDKTPEEAAEDETFRVKLLAAILMFEESDGHSADRFDFNALRRKLGLPTLEPIDPEQVTLKDLPLVRLSRVIAEKLSDEALLACFDRAAAFGAVRALRNFARAVIERPDVGTNEQRMGALAALVRIEDDSDRALDYLARGRKLAESEGKSSAQWDIMELSLRVKRGEGEQVGMMFQHLHSEHIEEPGVAEALRQILVQAGAIHPDGTPTSASAVTEEPDAAAEPEREKLWTPDGQEPESVGEKPKIWTPGMD